MNVSCQMMVEKPSQVICAIYASTSINYNISRELLPEHDNAAVSN